MSKGRMELLAPAGGMEQLKAAIRFGADAVYGGMRDYGLRSYASNYSVEELREAVTYCHDRNVKFYVTLNILPKDSDMNGFLASASQALECGADAAIVSDFGAALELSKRLPKLKIHISTQANVLNSVTATFFHEAVKAERIVLSRELSLEDISEISNKIPESLQLETFVHGAMCVSYSGRCLLSNAIMGRSGNRGACAQPCRWGYSLVEEKRPGEYYPVYEDERGTAILSAYDLCMIKHLPELRDAGICSLKIEGRMKTAYYVATVVGAYRHALDALELQGEEAYRAGLGEWVKELQKCSHRKSNTGFFFGTPIPCAGAEGFLQDMEYIGDFADDSPAGEWALLRLKNRFYEGDQLEVLSPAGVGSFTCGKIKKEESGEMVDTVSVAGTLVRIKVPFPVNTGDILRGPNRNHK